MLNKKNTKLLVEYVVASDKFRELWEEYQSVHDTPHQLRMIEAYTEVEAIQEQLLALMGNNENVLNGLAFMHGIIEGMLGDYIEKYSD